MAIINKLDNQASVTYGGVPVVSNTVRTLLLLPPTLFKAVDKADARIGETINYTVTVTNQALTALNDLPFTDVLPAGCTYVEGSFKVNDAAVTPAVTANTLSYTIPDIAAEEAATISFQCDVVGGEA